jgi:hypothetical protein
MWKRASGDAEGRGETILDVGRVKDGSRGRTSRRSTTVLDVRDILSVLNSQKDGSMDTLANSLGVCGTHFQQHHMM